MNEIEFTFMRTEYGNLRVEARVKGAIGLDEIMSGGVSRKDFICNMRDVALFFNQKRSELDKVGEQL